MKTYAVLLCCLIGVFAGNAQYISRSQPLPFACPSVCPGSTLLLEVFQVQNLNNGDTVQALLSNANGSFNSGTTILSGTRYSLNTGTSWVNGPCLFSSNINDLYFEITIPQNFPTGSSYTIKMKSSSGYTSSDLFQCNGGNYITVTAGYSTLSPVSPNTAGNNQWFGHVYTWTPTTGQQLTTPQLVAAQDFFNGNNYKGHFVKNSLSFDINYNTASGGTCPGTPGTLNDGTSIPCSGGISSDFSIRLLNHYNFPAGNYKFELQGDDGIRLSIDSGRTWLLSSYFEQTYPNSYQTTATNNPNGICLSGPTDLVIEFFQRNVDSHLTFTSTLLSSTSVGDAGNQTTCAGSNAVFRLNSSSTGVTYKWYYSTNGINFIPVPNAAPFSGTDSSALGITSVPANYNNYLFRCQLTGLCSNPVNTPIDTLFIGGNGAPATVTANKNPICSGDSSLICAPANCKAYQWNTNETTQCIYGKTAGNYYATVTYNTGCTASTNHYPLQIYPVSSVSIIVHGDTLTTLNGTNYQWFRNDTAITSATQSIYIAAVPGYYSVQITDANGCKTTSTKVNIGNVGINEAGYETEFSIYPNPVNSELIVTTPEMQQRKQVTLFDACGRHINNWQLTGNKTSIPVSSLATGVYFLKVDNIVRKFIKQ